jgi:hypothetical protein
MVPDPKTLIPRFTTIKTQSDRIILFWVVTGQQSAWSIDEFELQVCSTSPPAGPSPNEVSEWETLQLCKEMTFDYKGLDPGKQYQFRLRTVNRKGASDWVPGRFETRQMPVDNGGSGPGYRWKQTSNAVQALVACEEGIRAKEVSVECKGGRLRVEDRRPTPPAVLLDGELTEPVRSSEMAWALGSDPALGRVVVVTMEKQAPTKTRKEHWLSLVKGHPFVDRRFLAEDEISGKLEA